MPESAAWIVVIDRPYYPSVERFTTLTDAMKAYERAIAEEHDPGEHTLDAKIYIAEVLDERAIKTLH